MSLLLLLAAVALIPIVFVLMADGCARAATEPGSRPLRLFVTADPNNSEGGRENVRILNGRAAVHPPSGRPTPSFAVPEGGLLNQEIPVSPEMFEGTTAPFGWSAECTVEYESLGPARPGRGRVSGVYEFFWDANREGTIQLVLHLVDRSGGTVDPDPVRVRNWQWQIDGGGP